MNGVVNSIITSSHFDTFKNQLYAINTNFIVGNPDEIDNNNGTKNSRVYFVNYESTDVKLALN